MLFDIKDYVEGLLVNFRDLERLSMRNMSSRVRVSFVFFLGPSRPGEIGLDGVPLLIPSPTLALGLIHVKS